MNSPNASGSPPARGRLGETKRSELMQRPTIVPAETALVVVDMVNWNVPRIDAEAAPSFGDSPSPVHGDDSDYYTRRLAELVIPNHQRLLDRCRTAGLKVVFLRVGCAQPDYSDAIPLLRESRRRHGALDGSIACEVIEELAPEEGDVSILKTGSGGFTTSPLHFCLGSTGIKQVFYTGVVTNGCVLTTAVAGFDLGYYGYLVSDCTAAITDEMQKLAETLLGSAFAKVVSTEDVLDLIEAHL